MSCKNCHVKVSYAEALEKLKKYLLKQDPRIVADICANFWLDINRFLYMNRLDKKDFDSLIKRSKKNMELMISLVTTDNISDEDILRIIKD